jgi:N-acyl-D-aspartate/D-glutamate deacylase
MHDVVIRGGTVVDGTGAPARRADVAVRGGRVAAIGDRIETGRETVDASGCWVTPGFVDPHTHLDAQLCWDGSATPMNRHGITTVVIGLCGFGVAPCAAGGGEYLARSLERVEEIPYECTRRGVPFTWTSYREYLDHLAGLQLGVNVAGLVPHSALRVFAMGDRARGQLANDDDRAAMATELRDALAAGALGLATSRGPNHVDGYGDPVPSRYADERELRALVDECSDRVWQINIESKFGHDAETVTAELERYARWSRDSGARLTWSPFFAEHGDDVWRAILRHNADLNASGVLVAPQVSALPVSVLLRFDEPSFLVRIGGWQQIFDGYLDLDPETKLRFLADGAVRDALKRADPAAMFAPRFDEWVIASAPSRPGVAGTSLQEAAAQAGCHAVDFMCDQAIADGLGTLVQVMVANRDRAGARELLADARTLLGLGDAGAHVMSVTNYRYPTYILSEIVLRQQSVDLETAVNRMTSSAAEFYGLPDRGVLRAGARADIAVIDPARLALEPVRVVHDLPGEAPRLYQGAAGYRSVLVNGTRTILDDEPTGALPGTVIRRTTTGSNGLL